MKANVFIVCFLVAFVAMSGVFAKGTRKPVSRCLTLEEAASALQTHSAALSLAAEPEVSPELPDPFRPPFTSIEPIRLFDCLYFVGTTAVGAYVLNTGAGLVMFDTGCCDADAALMVADLRKLGLNPSEIRLICISHEHFDHYGGIQYLKKNVCPEAKVAMGLMAWNMLQSAPMVWPYIGKRPQKVDIFLTDGMKIGIGRKVLQIVGTPGHSPGCLSFIFSVTDSGVSHVVGLAGGSGVFPTEVETYQYKASVEYFGAIARTSGCDVGLGFHYQESNFSALRVRKKGEPHPMVLGTDGFDSVFLEGFRERYRKMLLSGEMIHYF